MTTSTQQSLRGARPLLHRRGAVAGAAPRVAAGRSVVPATAVAWLAGLAGFMAVSTPLWRPGQPWSVVAAVAILAGTVMAAITAAITGAALAQMLAGHPAPEPEGSRRDMRTAV